MDYFAKKQWIRIAVCAVLVAVAVLAMTGVFSGKEPLVYDPAAKNLPAGAVTAEATEKGFGGDVTVNLTLDGSTVQDLTIDTPNETEGLGKRASEAEFTEQFIGKEGPFTFGENGIEALSGATVTSTAALKAINRAITGEEAAEPAAEPEEPAAEPVEEPAQKSADEPAADASAIDMTEQGFGGDVTVHVTLDGEKIQALTIDTPNETDGLGKRASETAFTDQFIGKSGPFTYGEDGIEALSGATVTSNAVLKAINSAVGGEAAEEPANEPAEEKRESAQQEEKAGEAGSNGQAYGVYRASKQNDFSTITVTASAKNGKLTDVKITSEGEDGKDLLTDEIRSEWAKAILESGSANPDAITGATLKFSAGSVQEAMAEILSNMNAESTETPAEPEAEAKTPAEPAGEPAQPEEKTEEAGSNGQAYGVYRASKQNDFSTITVTASAKNGKLTDVKITSDGEDGKDLLTDEIRSEWAKAILESGSANPDAITGATLKFSAGSVQEAMEEILANMNGGADEETEEPSEEAAEEPVAEKPAAEEAAEEPTAEEPAAEEAAEEPTAEEPAAEEAAEEPVAEEPAAEEAAAEEPVAKETLKTPPAYAGYRVDKENQFSRITVIACAKSGKLNSVKILSEGEDGKDLLTDEIRDEWAGAILKSGSADPDAITGATLKFSAGSVQEAMGEILANMNGETAEDTEEPAEEPAAEESGEPAAGQEDIQTLITLSMGKEQENSYVTDYLEQDPYLVNIYEGYGFAKDYGSARGHYYTLTDVEKTKRPHAKANCLTCKTPDMHKMIEEQGNSVYSMPFDEVMAQMTQPISCYTCHGADDGNSGQMVVTHQYVNEALGENVSEVKAASLSCGQCHIEYYFTPEDSEAMMPYHSVAEMTPEAILAYYDELDFFDWEQPGTGTKMLKAQHPELETYSYGKHAAMLSCADCHMPVETTESGIQYHDHHLVSPLTSDTLLAKCAACHGSAENTIALVQGIQEKVTARETEVGNKLSALKDELTEAVTAGQMSEETLNAVRKLHREAQWYFDFCYVENAEGAHNSELAYRCLDTSESKIGEAMNLLAAAGTTDVSAGTPAEELAAEEPATEEIPAEELAAEEPATEEIPAEEPAAEEPAAEEIPAEEPAAEETPKTPPAYAGYRVTRENPYSRITVIAYAKSGKLISVKILSEGEDGKDLLTDAIREEWAKAILENGNAFPDAITGATLSFSAGSVQEAMTEILDRIAGK